MCDLCCCLSGAPLSNSEANASKMGGRYAGFVGNPQKFDITMCEAPCREPCCCLAAGLPFTYICAQVKTRHDVLNHVKPGSGWSNYKCGQGYFGACCCFRPGSMGEENCPSCCMVLEAVCCPGIATSATRFMMMDKYSLAPDKGDNRLVRFNNCLQCFTCIAWILNCVLDCGEEGDQCVRALDCVSDIVFCCISGCMIAQVYRELAVRRSSSAPGATKMHR